MYLLRKLKAGKTLMGIICVLGLLECAPAQAQYVLPKKNLNSAEPLASNERWSLKTNTLGWLLLTPNMGVEYSLSASPYNTWTLSGNVRASIGTEPDVLDYSQYKVYGGRLELRKYWHNRGRDPQNAYENIFDAAFSHERFNARTWRGYYFGLYAGYDNAKLKFSREGYRGDVYQVGVSYGLVRPIYNYPNSVLDLEFGINVGAAYLNGHKYELDKINNRYVNIRERKGFAHFPIVSDISVSLVYRYGPSIKNRHRYDQAKQVARIEAQAQRRKAAEAKRDEAAAKRAARQEAKAARKAAKEAAKNN